MLISPKHIASKKIAALDEITPDVITNAETNQGSKSATLNGEVSNLPVAGTSWFEYGLTTAYGSSTTPTAIAVDGAFSAAITDLTHGTLYHYRAVITKGGTNYYGLDAELTTTTLAVTTSAASSIGAQAATLNGSISSLYGNATLDVYFQWGWTTGYGYTGMTEQRAATGAFSRIVSGLPPATFHYRAAVTDGFNTAYGADLTFTIASMAALAADLDIAWLFYIDSATDRYWSTQAITVGVQPYLAMIDPASFSGITISNSFNGAGRIHFVDDFTVSVPNPSNTTITASELLGCAATVSVYTDDGTTAAVRRVFNLRVKNAQNAYQKILITFEDAAVQHLEGLYPETDNVDDKFKAVGNSELGGCMPVPFGTAYIPLPNVLVTGTPNQTYYVLGAYDAGWAYTIDEVQAPEGWANSVWTSADYDFDQSNDAGDDYRLFQAMIAETGVPETYANGVFLQSKRMPIRTKYSRDDTIDYTTPGDVVLTLLFDGTMPAGDIYSCWIQTELNGAFDTKKPRYEWLRGILSQSNTCFSIALDGTRMVRTLTKEAIKTITSASIPREINGNKGPYFKYEPVSDGKNYDGGVIEFPTTDGGAQDDLSKFSIELDGGTAPVTPASGSLLMPNVYDYESAHRNGALYYQREVDITGRLSFQTRPDMMVLNPDDVITVSGADYGSATAVVSRVSISSSLVVSIDAVVYGHALSNYADLPTFTRPTIPDVDPMTFDPWVPVTSGPRTTPSGGTGGGGGGGSGAPGTAGTIVAEEIEAATIITPYIDVTAISVDDVTAETVEATVSVEAPVITEDGARVTCYDVNDTDITADYEFVLGDYGRFLRMNSGSNQTFTMPNDVTFPLGTVITLRQTGAGKIVFASEAGVTINNFSGHTKTAGINAVVALIQYDQNKWDLVGKTSA